MWTKGEYDEHTDTSRVVKRCLAVGRKYLPKEYPGIYCDSDILSDFLYGVHKGLKKIKWDIGDPIFFLVRNGLYQVRKKRIRACDKFLISRCSVCKKKIKFSDKPCHGRTKETVTKEVITDLLDNHNINGDQDYEEN